MKKCLIFLCIMILPLVVSAKKSVMDPGLQEQVIKELNQRIYGVITTGDGINTGLLVVKNAGESKIVWGKLPGAKYCEENLKMGTSIIIKEVKAKKWGFRISFRTMEPIKCKVNKKYWEKIKKNDKEIEIERVRSVTRGKTYHFRVDFKFNEKYYANTPDNIKFINDTFAQGFVFFKSKPEVLSFVNKEFESKNSIEIGLSVGDVIKRLGLPVKKLKFKNRMIYKYRDWILKFEDGKVVDAEL